MSIIGSNILAGASGQAGYNLNNSLRFRQSASATLSRTPASASNRQTWTWSGWVKRGRLGVDVNGLFVGRTSAAPTYTLFYFSDTNTLNFLDNGGAALTTTQLFRDPSAWYHLVLAVDTTQATAANRVKMYVNGTQITSFSTETYPTQNANLNVNSTATQVIGDNTGASQYLDGYLAEVNFVDGSQLTPSSFGETSLTTGSWIPKKYTSTYGTNGFYLKFADASAATAAAIGKDSSGNGNNWTPSGISVTAGTTYDAMTDVPTNTSATVANYATWNPLLFYSTTVPTITNGNLTAGWNNTSMFCGSTMTCSSTGKTYAEFTLTTAGSTRIGIKDITNQSQYNGGYNYVANTGQIRDTSDTTVQTVATSTNGDIIGIAVDLSANTLQFYKNNTAIGTAVTIANSSNWAFWVGQNSSATPQQVDANFGQRPFSYTAPTGFVALNTYNLPDSTIKKGNTVMEALLYTGNGTNNRTVTGVGFNPSLTWVKSRSLANSHVLADSVRGTNANIYSNLTNAETAPASSGAGGIGQVTTDGFTLVQGTSNFDNTNTSSATYVAWNWLAGASTSSNTSGTITSTVSVNTTAGFSVATFTGNGTAGATIGHGLGVAPKMIIVKSRSATGDWWVYHASIGATKVLFLSLTDAELTFAAWNNTAPTSSVFTIGSAGGLNVNSVTQVAYCWAEIAGFSKFGSYTGNGSADGPFIYLGFRPKYVLVKASSSVEAWYINDSARDTYNPDLRILAPNLADAEFNNGSTWMDLTSNGFKIRYNTAPFNTNAATYIYMAFAENPFKNSNAR